MKFRLTFSLLLLASPGAYANCFDAAAAYHHVNGDVLRAIAWLESHNQPMAEHRNENGSVDYGVMQINSIHLAQWSRYGVDREALLQPCKNVYVAAWHLRHQMDRYGNTWAAIGSYHSATPQYRDQYVAQIKRILRGWLRFPDGSGGSDGSGTERIQAVADGTADIGTGSRSRRALSLAAQNSVKTNDLIRFRNASSRAAAPGLNTDREAPTVQ